MIIRRSGPGPSMLARLMIMYRYIHMPACSYIDISTYCRPAHMHALKLAGLMIIYTYSHLYIYSRSYLIICTHVD